MTLGFSMERLETVGIAGAGAVAASLVQASTDFGLGDNLRDVALAAVAVMGAAQGGASMRAFALGVGAAAVGSLIRRNVLSTL